MPDSTGFYDKYVVMGVVFVCVLTALALLGAGMIDTRESTPQPSSQAPTITQPSTQPPASSETRAPASQP
jgi:hypothetical protein